MSCTTFTTFTNLVSFGASYLDSGSHNAGTFIPPTTELLNNPAGLNQAGTRSSNGPTFPEVLAAGDSLQANYLSSVGGCTGNLLHATLTDAAYSGAACDTTIFGGAVPTQAPFDVVQQVDTILAAGSINSSTLYLFMAATQDISGIVASGNPTSTAQLVANCFSTQMGRLAAAGATNFLLAGIYPFDLAPQNAGQTAAAKMNIATQVSTLNQLMSVIPSSMVAAHPGTQTWFMDTNAFYLNNLIASPTKFYGSAGNVTAMCSANAQAAGACANNADAFLWWDVHHPTRQTHKYIAQYMFSLLTQAATTQQVAQVAAATATSAKSTSKVSSTSMKSTTVKSTALKTSTCSVSRLKNASKTTTSKTHPTSSKTATSKPTKTTSKTNPTSLKTTTKTTAGTATTSITRIKSAMLTTTSALSMTAKATTVTTIVPATSIKNVLSSSGHRSFKTGVTVFAAIVTYWIV
ncbi:hypothetical protein HDU82_008353 [Entophlyctis luteolus]|nr:hypothetical protein HDU82_008353 [Entophlyctis luteolus]